MSKIIKDINELSTIPLGNIIDEALSSATRISFYRIKTKPNDKDIFTSALILCAAKGSSFYNEQKSISVSQKTIPACNMRMRTVKATLEQCAMRMSDISCFTTDPECFIMATIIPQTIDYIESLMENIQISN